MTNEVVVVATDRDLPPAQRTEANWWRGKYLEMHAEVQKANRGTTRLRRRLDKANEIIRMVKHESPALFNSVTKTAGVQRSLFGSH